MLTGSGMEHEQLQMAISLLEATNENLDPALSRLASCHNTFLKSGDENGFWWSFHLLQGIICRTPYKLKSQDELFSTLVSIFASSEMPGVESALALAAVHVGRTVEAEGKDWFSKCLEHAKTERLKYEAATGLGVVSKSHEEALDWFLKARNFIPSTVASYRVSAALAALGRHKEAVTLLEEVTDSHNFSLALAAMLRALIASSSFAHGFASLETVIAAYSSARTMLPPLMANWEMKMWKYLDCESPCMDLLIKFLRMDLCSKYLLSSKDQHRTEWSQAHVPDELEQCLFVFELYKSSRKEMVELQGGGIILEEFMDPRPHLEHGMEILFSKEPRRSLEPLVLCQQIAVKVCHATGFFLASMFIGQYIENLEIEGLSQEEIIVILESAFQNEGQDGEDVKAWAAYHVGRTGASGGKVSESHYKCLELAFQKYRTPFLGFHLSEALANATTDLTKKIDYLETMRLHALFLEREEFIIGALSDLFNVLVHEARLYDRASGVQKELQRKFPDSKLSEGISAFMEGSLNIALQSHSKAHPEMHRAVACFELLPRYDPVTTLSTYFTNKDDLWCWIKNSNAQIFYGNALMFIQDPYQPLPYKVSDEYDTANAALAHLANITNNAKLLLGAGALEEAEEEAANALQLLQEQGEIIGPRSMVEIASVLMTLARLVCAYYRQQQSAAAGNHLPPLQMLATFANEAIRVAGLADETLLCKNLSLSLKYSYGLLLNELGEKSAALVELEEFHYKLFLEETVSSFGSSSMARIKLLDNLKHRNQFLQSLMWESGDLWKALVWAERGRAQDLLFSLKSLNDRDSYLKELLEFDSDYEKGWLEMKITSDMLGRDTVIMVVSVSKLMDGSIFDIFLYLLHSGSEIVGHRSIEDLKALQSVDQLLQAIWVSQDTEEMLQAYYRLLISPFEEHLERIQPKRIIFVPNEEYCMIPFAALMDKTRPEQPYLIQRYATGTTHSMRMLKQCLMRGDNLAKQHVPGRSPALLVLPNEGPNQDYLEFAAQEIEFVQSAMEEAGYRITKLVNENAGKQMVLEALADCSWVHVASHAVRNNEFPDGALILSTGPLMGDEIQELGVVVNASAVVLSSCSSGIGRVFAEGIVALSRSFHVLGAPSSIVSLWPVDDEVTSCFMEVVYKSLVNGMEILEALQAAMVDILGKKTENSDFQTLAYGVKHWAAFALSGSPCVKLNK